MSLATACAAILDKFNINNGEPITYGGNDYYAVVKKGAGRDTGESNIPIGTYGMFVVSSLPVVMSFNASDFAPTTSVAAPCEGEIVKRNGVNYMITAAEYINMGTVGAAETVAYKCLALRFIWQTTPQ